MKNSTSFRVGIVVLVLIVIGAAGYFMSKGNSAPTGTTSASLPTYTASPAVSTTGWKEYSDPELGFSFQYPSAFTFASAGSKVTLAVPKSYFTGKLVDTVTLSVAAVSQCPVDDSAASKQLKATLGGIEYIRHESSNGAAGTVENTVWYTHVANGSCYVLQYVNRGTNGAGAVGNSPQEIATINATHTQDIKNLMSVVDTVFGSFKLLVSPVGESESSHSAILISEVKPSVATIGQDFSVIGRGFSGQGVTVKIMQNYVAGFLWYGTPKVDTQIDISKFPRTVCTTNVVASGKTCPKSIPLTAGPAAIIVQNANGTSGTFPITIK